MIFSGIHSATATPEKDTSLKGTALAAGGCKAFGAKARMFHITLVLSAQGSHYKSYFMPFAPTAATERSFFPKRGVKEAAIFSALLVPSPYEHKLLPNAEELSALRLPKNNPNHWR